MMPPTVILIPLTARVDVIPLPAGADLRPAGIHRRVADQYAAVTVRGRGELRRHILTEQGDVRSMDAVSHGQGAAEIAAGLRETHRRARPKGDIRQVEVIRQGKA